jgi:hypothetical protein
LCGLRGAPTQGPAPAHSRHWRQAPYRQLFDPHPTTILGPWLRANLRRVVSRFSRRNRVLGHKLGALRRSCCCCCCVSASPSVCAGLDTPVRRATCQRLAPTKAPALVLVCLALRTGPPSTLLVTSCTSLPRALFSRISAYSQIRRLQARTLWLHGSAGADSCCDLRH